MGEVVPFPEPDALPPFRREGLGYVYEPDGYHVTFRADFLKRRSEELHGVLTVETTQPGLPPHLHEATHNFSSLASRTSVAKVLAERAPATPWRDLLELFCVSVMRAERQGMPFVELSAEQEHPREPDQVEMLIPWRAPTWLYGEGGSCKGLIATAIAIAVATGRDFIGLRTRQTGVAYLDWEDDHDEMVHRISTVCRGLDIARPKFFWRSCKRGGPLKSQVHTIAQQFAELGIGFYVIDSVGLAAGMGGERANPEDSALALFEAMGVLDATPLCIDHVSKADAANKGIGAKAYGTIYKENLARHMWEVRKDQEEGSTEATVGLFNRKTNRGATLKPVGLRINWYGDEAIVLQRADVRMSAKLATGGGPTLRIEHVLSTSRGLMTVREIADEIGEPPDKVRATLNQSSRFQKAGDRWGLAVREGA